MACDVSPVAMFGNARIFTAPITGNPSLMIMHHKMPLFSLSSPSKSLQHHKYNSGQLTEETNNFQRIPSSLLLHIDIICHHYMIDESCFK